MCRACTENYAAVEESGKQEVAEDLRALASAIVSAAHDGGKNPAEIAVALEIARTYTRMQMDEEVLAIVDDIGRRGAALVVESFRQRGIVLRPKSHEPMAFSAPEEPARLAPDAERPARPGAAPRRRAIRAGWRN